MWHVNLTRLGLLGIAMWLKSRQPRISSQLGRLESVEGWVGIFGLVRLVGYFSIL